MLGRMKTKKRLLEMATSLSEKKRMNIVSGIEKLDSDIYAMSSQLIIA